VQVINKPCVKYITGVHLISWTHTRGSETNMSEGWQRRCVVDTHSGAASIERLTSISSTPPPRETCPSILLVEASSNSPPPPEDLNRPDIGKGPERDCSNEYYIRSGETQFTVQMEKTGVNIGDKVHVQWRHTQGVQKYRCTDVHMYICTDVQMYRSTGKCCYREDGGSWFNKKGPGHVQLRIALKKLLGRGRGGGKWWRVEAQTTTNSSENG
jgi:hypothetical protein